MITKQTAIARTLLLVLLPSGFSCLRSDAVAAAPDLVWTPQPWRFESGPSVRYIDFENGVNIVRLHNNYTADENF